MADAVIKGSGFNRDGGGFAEIIIDGVGYKPDAVKRAVTAHDDLVAALKEIADEFEATIAGEGYDPDHCDCPVLDKTRAALAKAARAEERGARPEYWETTLNDGDT